MKINGLNSGISFSRAIEVSSNTLKGRYGNRIDKNTRNVLNAFENKKSVYDGDVSWEIRNFLFEQMGDVQQKEVYSKEKQARILRNKVYSRRIQGHLYIFTGEEYNKACEIDKRAKEERAALDKKTQKAEIERVNARRDRELLLMVENGGLDTMYRKKPLSRIDLKMDAKGKLNSIEYFSTKAAKDKKSTNKILYLV